MMTPAEKRLAKRAVAGDVDARNQIIMSMWPYIYRQAIRFAARSGLDPDDLAHAAVVRIIDGFPKFDPSKGFRPITYFGRAMLHAMIQHDCHDRPIKRPTSWQHCNRGIEAAEKTRVVRSLSEPIPDERGKDDMSLGDAIADPHALNAADDVARLNAVALLWQAISALPARLRNVVLWRMDGQTFCAIAHKMGLSKQRIQQLEIDAHAQIALLVARYRRAA